MTNLIKHNSSNAIFVRWDELDERIAQWSVEHLGTYGASGARDDNDFNIEIVFRGCNVAETNASMDALYEKYDTEKDFETDYIGTPFGTVELAPPVALGIVNEIFAADEKLHDFAAKRAIALYDGVLFFSNDITINI